MQLCLTKRRHSWATWDELAEMLVAEYDIITPDAAAAEPEPAAEENHDDDDESDYGDYEDDGYDSYDEEEKCRATSDHIHELLGNMYKSNSDPNRAYTLRCILQIFTYDPYAHKILEQTATRQHYADLLRKSATACWFQQGFYIDSSTKREAGPLNRAAWNAFVTKIALFK